MIMLQNKQSLRSLIAFIVIWSFLILTLTGIILYIVPRGSISHWIDWNIIGLGKHKWANIHMIFGVVFILIAAFHLYFNWKPLKQYFAERVSGHLRVKREFVISLIITVLIIGGAVLEIPPIRWVFDLNKSIKRDAWIGSSELEPPFRHAEEVSLLKFCRRLNLDPEEIQTLLRARGFRFDGVGDSLRKIAATNKSTPMAIYSLINRGQTKTVELDTPIDSIQRK